MERALEAIRITVCFSVCFLAICGLQYEFGRWLMKDFMPEPFERTTIQSGSAKCLNARDKGNYHDKELYPSRQKPEGNDRQNDEEDSYLDTLFFASIWSHAVLPVASRLISILAKGK